MKSIRRLLATLPVWSNMRSTRSMRPTT